MSGCLVIKLHSFIDSNQQNHLSWKKSLGAFNDVIMQEMGHRVGNICSMLSIIHHRCHGLFVWTGIIFISIEGGMSRSLNAKWLKPNSLEDNNSLTNLWLTPKIIVIDHILVQHVSPTGRYSTRLLRKYLAYTFRLASYDVGHVLWNVYILFCMTP